MTLLNVRRELQFRELTSDCIAYYPWGFTQDFRHPSGRYIKERLGLDSLGFFYIGGDVEARMNWDIHHIERLTSAAGREEVVSDWNDMVLDTYDEKDKWPGQPWYCYKSTLAKKKEDLYDKDLKKSLTALLTPTTTIEEWHARKGPRGEISWLRFRQKRTGKNDFLVNGRVHKGAHMPLLVFTENSQSTRSEDGEQKQKLKQRWRTVGWWSSDAWGSSDWWSR